MTDNRATIGLAWLFCEVQPSSLCPPLFENPSPIEKLPLQTKRKHHPPKTSLETHLNTAHNPPLSQIPETPNPQKNPFFEYDDMITQIQKQFIMSEMSTLQKWKGSVSAVWIVVRRIRGWKLGIHIGEESMMLFGGGMEISTDREQTLGGGEVWLVFSAVFQCLDVFLLYFAHTSLRVGYVPFAKNAAR